jgi:hypothetical protein
MQIAKPLKQINVALFCYARRSEHNYRKAPFDNSKRAVKKIGGREPLGYDITRFH